MPCENASDSYISTFHLVLSAQHPQECHYTLRIRNKSSSLMLTYEFPLNEKSRTYLRFDALFQQLKNCQQLEQSTQSFSFSRHYLISSSFQDRCDIRTDLMKDLEKQRQKLEAGASYPRWT